MAKQTKQFGQNMKRRNKIIEMGLVYYLFITYNQTGKHKSREEDIKSMAWGEGNNTTRKT